MKYEDLFFEVLFFEEDDIVTISCSGFSCDEEGEHFCPFVD